MIVVKKSLNESFLVTISMTIEKSKIKIIVNSFPIVKLTLIGLSNFRVSYFHAIHRFNKQSFFFFLRNKHTHTRERERNSNTKTHHNSTQKPQSGSTNNRYFTINDESLSMKNSHFVFYSILTLRLLLVYKIQISLSIHSNGAKNLAFQLHQKLFYLFYLHTCCSSRSILTFNTIK